MKKILLISLLFVPVFASASIDINLKYGATGSEVIELQEFLVDKGFLVSNATGNFFSLTNSAVVKYQGSVGLPTTGFVGPMTREKINAELGQKISTANQQEVVETGSFSTASVNDKITQMLNQIKTLQELIAKQNQTQQSTLESLQQIQQNTTPTPVYVPPTPSQPSLSVSYTPTCKITQELFGNINNTGVSGYADVYNVEIPINISSPKEWSVATTLLFVDGSQLAGQTYGPKNPTIGTNDPMIEISQTNLPNHTHRDWTKETTVEMRTTVGSLSNTQQIIVPACQ